MVGLFGVCLLGVIFAHLFYTEKERLNSGGLAGSVISTLFFENRSEVKFSAKDGSTFFGSFGFFGVGKNVKVKRVTCHLC